MADIINLSVKSQYFQPITEYFDEELNREIDDWHEARKALRNHIYDYIDEIVKEGEKIQEQRKRGEEV